MCDGKEVYIKASFILTVPENSDVATFSYSKSHYIFYHDHDATKPGYRLLPENISELNDFMCGPLNRKGYLCSDCIDGFGPSMSMIEHPNDCYRCKDINWHGVTLHLIIILVPVTLFYLIIFVFQIRMTSAPMPCFVLYSQIIVSTLSYPWGRSFREVSLIMFTDAGDLRTVSRLILSLYGIFDLDFISNAVPPFCISSKMTLYHRAVLSYITAFYPMLLIVITWVSIRLHDHKFRVMVFLWRPFHKCFVRLRRGWDTKNDLIDVFATFFLLSYVKVFYETILFISTTMLNTYSLRDGSLKISYVSNIDIDILVLLVQDIS